MRRLATARTLPAMQASSTATVASGHDGAAVVRTRAGRAIVLTLDRPAARNALTLELILALDAAIAAVALDADIGAIVLAGNGPAFSSGHDLKELTGHRADADGGRAFYEQVMRACAALMLRIVASPKPVVAAVEGVATAAGCQLVASADLAVAGADARFATPGVSIGLFCSTPMVALSRNLSRKRAMEMLLLGEMLDAEAAATHGLVNRVVPAGGALAAATDLAQKIAAKSPLTVAIGKEAFHRQLDMPLAQAYDYAAEVMVGNMLTEDAREGIGAFLQRRQPGWKGC